MIYSFLVKASWLGASLASFVCSIATYSLLPNLIWNYLPFSFIILIGSGVIILISGSITVSLPPNFFLGSSTTNGGLGSSKAYP